MCAGTWRDTKGALLLSPWTHVCPPAQRQMLRVSEALQVEWISALTLPLCLALPFLPLPACVSFIACLVGSPKILK